MIAERSRSFACHDGGDISIALRNLAADGSILEFKVVLQLAGIEDAGDVLVLASFQPVSIYLKQRLS
jgi:hypothetical protein